MEIYCTGCKNSESLWHLNHKMLLHFLSLLLPFLPLSLPPSFLPFLLFSLPLPPLLKFGGILGGCDNRELSSPSSYSRIWYLPERIRQRAFLTPSRFILQTIDSKQMRLRGKGIPFSPKNPL